jgi:hypothetical protein
MPWRLVNFSCTVREARSRLLTEAHLACALGITESRKVR